MSLVSLSFNQLIKVGGVKPSLGSDLTGLMETMGFPQEEVRAALDGQKYNEVTATYLLLGRRPAQVGRVSGSTPGAAQLRLQPPLF